MRASLQLHAFWVAATGGSRDQGGYLTWNQSAARVESTSWAILCMHGKHSNLRSQPEM